MTPRISPWLLRVFPLAVVACTGACSPDSDSSAGDGDDGTMLPFEPPSDDPCERILGGPPSDAESPLLDLSAAHATVRYFGAHSAYSEVDEALTNAVGDERTFSVRNTLGAYVEGVKGACLVPASTASWGAMKARVVDTTAFITLGEGDVSVPDSVTDVVVDLRDVSEHAALGPALERAVSVALDKPLTRPRRMVRKHVGQRDEVFVELIGEDDPNYFTVLAEQRPDAIAAGGKARNLILFTDERLAPTAAELAATLRLAQLAHLVGHDVVSAVAESSFVPVAELGLSVRTHDLYLWDEDARFPDVIPADVHTTKPEQHLAEVLGKGKPPAVELTAAKRPALEQLDPLADQQSKTRTRATARAALLIAHGTLRRFYPYFEVAGEDLDAVFTQEMEQLDALDTVRDEDVLAALDRIGASLGESSSWAYDLEHAGEGYAVSRRRFDPAKLRFLPVVFDLAGEDLIVSGSAVDDIAPGERIVARNGVALEDFAFEHLPRVAGARLPTRQLRTAEWFSMVTTRTVTLTVADGSTTRDVEVETIDAEAYDRLLARAVVRPSGWLGELGADDVYYINLDAVFAEAIGDSLTPTQHLDAAIEGNARALVLDQRGRASPSGRLVSYRMTTLEAPMKSAQWWFLQWTGPDQLERVMQQDDYVPGFTDTTFAGPVALLIGPRTGGGAETVTQALVGAKRVTTVGRNSGGSNGNITGMELPGRFGLTFTGLEDRNPDGSRFHGLGVAPDVHVPSTRSTIASTIDEDIVRALEVLAD